MLLVLTNVFGIEFLSKTGASLWLIGLASFTLLTTSIIAIYKDDIKARLAYSTISQLSYITLGGALASSIATQGAALHIVTHAAGKITLFFVAGAIYVGAKLSKISQIKVPNPQSGHEHIYQMYTIMLENKKTRDDLHNFLIEKEIFSKVYFYPIHKTQFYSKFTPTSELPITDKISNQVLTIPLYPNMTKGEKEYLVDSIMEFFDSR